MKNNILLTGGSGLLGRELRKYIECEAPSHKSLDITDPVTFNGKYDTIIHCAAYTEVTLAETNRWQCFSVNVEGTINLLKDYRNTRFVYISSEYANNPVNFYSKTKLAGELAVEAYCDNYLIVRTLFKPKPFPWNKAFFDQYTQGDYVDVIAPLIANQIKNWDGASKIIYVGTGRKTMLELAQKTKPLIIACSVKDVKGVTLPKDYL